MHPKLWIVAAGISGALAVGLGAYGAHGLEKRVASLVGSEVETAKAQADKEIAKRLANWDTAARYHMVHAVALAAVGLAAALWPTRCWRLAGAGFILGMLLFSGLLYVMAATTVSGLGLGVMVGGLFYIAGWLALAAAAAAIPRNAA